MNFIFHFCRPIQVFSMLVFLASCSGLKVAYNQLDWFIPEYIDQYVTLNDEQYRIMELKIETLLQWHCGQQLQRYADWLKTIGDDLQNDRIHFQRLTEHRQHLKHFWEEIITQATPGAVVLLGKLDPDQQAQLRESMTEKNIELRNDYVDQTKKKIQQILIDHMEGRVERWIDALNKPQERIIKDWSEQVVGGQHLWLENRERWQSRFFAILEKNQAKPKEFRIQMTDMLTDPEKVWSVEYREHVEHYRHSVLRMIDRLVKSLTKTQREYFIEKTNSYASDFRDLSCKTPAKTASK